MLKSKAPGAAPLINAYLKPLFAQKDLSERPSLSRGLKPYLLALAWVLSLAYFYREALRSVFHFAAHNDNASHILLVPLISAWLLYRDRKHLTVLPTLDFRTPFILLIPAILVLSFSSYSQSLNASERLAGLILSLVLFLQAGFIAIEGRNVARASWFGLAFLFLAVPLPDVAENRVIYILQAASSAVAERLFDWSGVPVLRDGFVFHLPRVSIEVAEECSGIRSSMALLILAILLSHFAFRKFWKKLVLLRLDSASWS